MSRSARAATNSNFGVQGRLTGIAVSSNLPTNADGTDDVGAFFQSPPAASGGKKTKKTPFVVQTKPVNPPKQTLVAPNSASRKQGRIARPDQYHQLGEKGRKTGVQVNKDVPLNADGTEAVNQFFKSPPQSTRSTRKASASAKRNKSDVSVQLGRRREASLPYEQDDTIQYDDGTQSMDMDETSFFGKDLDRRASRVSTRSLARSEQDPDSSARTNKTYNKSRLSIVNGASDSEQEQDSDDQSVYAKTGNRAAANRHTPASLSASPARRGTTRLDSSPSTGKSGKYAEPLVQDDFDDQPQDDYGNDYGNDYDDDGGLDPVQEEEDEENDPPPASRSRDKGKGRATYSDEEQEEEQGDMSEEEPAPRKTAPAARGKKRKRDFNAASPDGVRRSNRTRMQPLAHWRNEYVSYARRDSGPAPHLVIAAIHRVPEAENRIKSRARSTSKKPATTKKKPAKRQERIQYNNETYEEDGEGVDEVEFEDMDILTDPDGTVWDYETGTEIRRKIAFTSKMVNPKHNTSGSGFHFQKIFSDGEYMAGGVLEIPVGSKKPLKPARDNTYMLFLQRGVLRVTIHRTAFTIATGGFFLVPRGNAYQIENVADVDARIVFMQAREVPTLIEEEEPQQEEEQYPEGEEV